MSQFQQYHRFLCGCTVENGIAFPCHEHQVSHLQHRTPAPGCGQCESLLAEARELRAEQNETMSIWP